MQEKTVLFQLPSVITSPRIEGRSAPRPQRINGFLSITVNGNKSVALLLTIFELTHRRGNESFTSQI
jgi:hypothetical protein